MGVVDTTINNHDGRIVANNAGVFVYEFTLEPPFTLLNYVKKFSTSGQLLTEVEAATFTTAIALYTDMVVTPTRLAIFAKNSFNGDSHEIIIYDHNLNLVNEKAINGPSGNYSGQIASLGEDLFVAHIHSGDLNFDDELDLSYTGSGNKPYIAKLGTISTTGISDKKIKKEGLSVYPNPADDKITVSFSGINNHLVSLLILNNNGQTVWGKSEPVNATSINISQLTSGLYFIQAYFSDGTSWQEKLLVR
ncbi:MAG: T9SS type A sorting domain-containing protein [Bacteroidales bacterium]